jgi:phospholipid/cholesterol/gamma-HCH transport system ATP-binding protein
MSGDDGTAPVIRVEHLVASYRDVVILDDVSCEVRRGEVFLIVGGSGSGKTSFQGGALFGSLTLGQNVALPLEEYTTLPPATIQLLVRLKLAMVKLEGYEDFMISELSGGMKKRAALARALALDPAILFFDEPSAGLDPITSVELDQFILQINKSLRTTIVVVSHELPSIFTIADRCIMLDGESKRIIAEGPPQELRNHPDPKVYAFFNRKPREDRERQRSA